MVKTNCPNCGENCRMGIEEVGRDSRGLPINHSFAYCKSCRMKYDLDVQRDLFNAEPRSVGAKKSKEKRKDSVLSIIACVLSGVAFIFPMIAIIGMMLALAGMIVGLVDIGTGNKEERHLGSYFSIVVFVIYCVVMYRL